MIFSQKFNNLVAMLRIFQNKKLIRNFYKVLGCSDGLLIFFVAYFIYLLTIYPTVQTEDSGELITAAAALDIAHPPGYPLYVLLGKIFSIIIPFGNIAWRINIMSAVFAAGSVGLMYFILKRTTKNDLVAMGGSLLFAFTDIFWSQGIRSEVYTLNQFCLTLLIYLLLLWHQTEEDRWLYLSALAYGISLTNHHLMFLAGPAIIVFVLVRNWRVILDIKLLLLCIALFLLGLSIYGYIPLRTALGGPYDNPAFIDHSGLHTWDTFIGFVNRKIYGGTVHLATSEITQEVAKSYLPGWLIGIKDFFFNYGKQFIQNNAAGLGILLKITFRELLYLPLLLFLPGIYALFKKDWRWALCIMLFFFTFTMGLTTFVYLDNNSGPFSQFSARPFFIPAIFLAALVITEGYMWLREGIGNKKTGPVFEALFFIAPLLLIQFNFAANNESKNYVAHDFNKNALQSVPQNGYLISTGRDNMTFPLYYLQKVANFRRDVNLEIYYSSATISEEYLKNKLAGTGSETIFIDLAPPEFDKIGIQPYGFIYQYGKILPDPFKNTDWELRGEKKTMDYPNNRLKGLFAIKLGVSEPDPAKRKEYFQKVIDEIPENSALLNFIGDYNRNREELFQAKEAYSKSGNHEASQEIENTLLQGTTLEGNKYQIGMF